MDSQFEKPKTFTKHTGKETAVSIVNEIPINNGAFGEIFDTVIKINGRKKRFIVKKYFDKSKIRDRPIATINAQTAFANYSLAKEAELKVFPTFRIGEDKRSILMTDGFSDNQICIGSNNSKSVIDFEQPLIGKIKDEDKFLSAFFSEGLKAGQKGIRLYFDMFR